MTSLAFDEAALELLPKATEHIQRLRKQAFEEYRALSVPSQETEEWRYTDLSSFDLSFTPHAPGHGKGAPPIGGARAAVQIQHNSSVVMTTSGQDLAGTGVVCCDRDDAIERYPDAVEEHLHALVPTSRTKFAALHGAF